MRENLKHTIIVADCGQKDGKKCLLTAALYLSREFLGENISQRELSDSCADGLT